jgi:hypothetical protein
LRVFSKFCVDQGYTQEEKKQYRLQVFGIKNDQSRLRNPLMKKKPRKSQFDVLQSIEDRKVFAQEK